jgi:hypothetical protein
MKKIFFTLIIGCVANTLFGQSITPHTFNSTGGSGNLGGKTYDYSIGEMVIVNTATTTNNNYTQGFLQPHTLQADAIENATLFQSSFSIFPNPSTGLLYITSLNNASINSMQLLDASGKLILNQTNPIKNNNQYSMDFSEQPVGNYLLRITNGTEYYTLKVIKNK